MEPKDYVQVFEAGFLKKELGDDAYTPLTPPSARIVEIRVLGYDAPTVDLWKTTPLVTVADDGRVVVDGVDYYLTTVRWREDGWQYSEEVEGETCFEVQAILAKDRPARVQWFNLDAYDRAVDAL